MVIDWFRRLPWWATAAIVALWAVGTASFAYYFTSDLFHETCLNERNLLTGEVEPSNCGEGAKLASAQGEEPATAGAATAASTDVPMASDGTPSPTLAAEATATATASPETASPPPTSTPEPGTPEEESPRVVARGTFEDGEPGHDGSGKAEIQRLADGSFNLFLSEFSVTNGPDLFIVLTRDPGGNYSDGDLVLEALKANNGNQNYAIPAGIDISQYGAVLVWCRQFDVEFAFATLGGVR